MRYYGARQVTIENELVSIIYTDKYRGISYIPPVVQFHVKSPGKTSTLKKSIFSLVFHFSIIPPPKKKNSSVPLLHSALSRILNEVDNMASFAWIINLAQLVWLSKLSLLSIFIRNMTSCRKLSLPCFLPINRVLSR